MGMDARGAQMKVKRRFTKPDTDVFACVEWERSTSRITNADGTVVFEMNDAEVPASWSQLATDIVVSKYFRKAGVPQTDAMANPLLDEVEEAVVRDDDHRVDVLRQLADRLVRLPRPPHPLHRRLAHRVEPGRRRRDWW